MVIPDVWFYLDNIETFTSRCPAATSLVGNLAGHCRYMLASVAYLRDQIQRKPRILQLGMEVVAFLFYFNLQLSFMFCIHLIMLCCLTRPLRSTPFLLKRNTP